MINYTYRNLMELAKKGVSKPHKIVLLLTGRLLGWLFPESRWGPNSYITKEGMVTFRDGEFVGSPSGRDEFSGKLYYELKSIRDNLDKFLPTNKVENSLEIGCGYGRHSPWLAEFSKNHWAIDPNEEVLERAKKQYPHVNFVNDSAQNLSFPGNHFGFVLTWTVLQHIPPDSISEVAEEINRVISSKGTLIIAENTNDNLEGPRVWGRSESEYANLLGMELVFSSPKPTEYNDENFSDFCHPNDSVMVFKNG